MAKQSGNDSHITNSKQKEEDGPLRQHFRLAIGEKLTGQQNEPQERLPVNNRSTIAGQRKTY